MLVLLLAAFLGVLTAVIARMLRLPGARRRPRWCWAGSWSRRCSAPSPAPRRTSSPAARRWSDQALALVVATIAAAVTLGVPAER